MAAVLITGPAAAAYGLPSLSDNDGSHIAEDGKKDDDKKEEDGKVKK